MMTLFSQLTDQQLCLVLGTIKKSGRVSVARAFVEDTFVSKTMYADLGRLRLCSLQPANRV